MKEENFGVINPLVSIVTATYNAKEYLPRLIASLRNQVNKNFEWVVVDGASTDGTLEILNNVNDINLTVDSRPDNGVYDAFNRAAQIASGNYILFLGADDFLVCDLSKLADNFTDLNTLYYGDVYMPMRHRIIGGKFSKLRLAIHNICQQAIFYPRSVFTKYKFNTDYPLWADYLLNIKCFNDREYFCQYLPVLVSYFNDYSGLTAFKNDEFFLKNKVSIIYKNFPTRVFCQFILISYPINLTSRLKFKILQKRSAI